MKCIIVEDEELAQEVIRDHLQKVDGFELVATCRNAPEAVKVLQSAEVDLMFLDIRLPGMSGLHFLRTIPNPPLVVLTTAYAEYALESYEFNVIDYLLKPISFERFLKTVNKIADGRLYAGIGREGQPASDHIFIKSGTKFFKVNFSEITYVQGMRDYLKIHTPDFTLITHQTMNEMERILPATQFIRVHKSYIVAVGFIKSVFGNTIELVSTTLPIGINYKEEVMNFIARKR
jgi:two-component system, LytTR family, response regulator